MASHYDGKGLEKFDLDGRRAQPTSEAHQGLQTAIAIVSASFPWPTLSKNRSLHIELLAQEI